MARPIIRFNSASGSDTQASGAGPDPALFGTSASTDASGLVVTLDPSTDLTNVATDGSHALFLNISTAGARNFARIVAKDNVVKTVTVGEAYPINLTGLSWAIGGRRQLLSSTTSRKLFNNNTGNGDAMPGWVLEMESGYADSTGSPMDFYRAGDVLDGPITLRGASGASPKPLITFTHNGNGVVSRNAHQQFQNFRLINSNTTKTASIGFRTMGTAAAVLVEGLEIGLGGIFFRGIVHETGSCVIRRCFVFSSQDDNVRLSNQSLIEGCVLDSSQTGSGINITSPGLSVVESCLIQGNAQNGIRYTATGSAAMTGPRIEGCVVANNASHGIYFQSVTDRIGGACLVNNVLVNNGGHGLFFESPYSLERLRFLNVRVLNNGYSGNVSGAINVAGLDEDGISPATFDNASYLASLELGPQSNLLGAGYPRNRVANLPDVLTFWDVNLLQRRFERYPRQLLVYNNVVF